MRTRDRKPEPKVELQVWESPEKRNLHVVESLSGKVYRRRSPQEGSIDIGIFRDMGVSR